ncbi:MAG TPA: RNA polymerase sigma factor [Actinomycetota bacterium]|nr:RNA polymerase sigma factor [Actinomycetota bacterium]
MGGRPLEETELVERARNGDVHAYEELVRRYQEAAVRLAYPIVGAPGEAEDAVQDALVKAYYALGRFRPGMPFRPWILRIVTNEARNRRKAAGRRAHLALRVTQDRPSGDAVPSPEASVLEDERRRTLLEAVNRMAEKDRVVIAYRYFLEMSEEEMAESLGWARGTVKSRLSRAMRRLRGILSEVGMPEDDAMGGSGA